jgi:hypothetical protein
MWISPTQKEAWEAQPYVAIAKKQGYVPEIREPAAWGNNVDALLARGKHDVPRDTIEQQLRRYTPYASEF